MPQRPRLRRLCFAWAWLASGPCQDGRPRSLAVDFAFRANPLEAAGAVVVVANFAMVFAVRGTETTFDNLRALGWYDAIPQLGAVLFAAGWWSGPLDATLPKSMEPPKLRDVGSVALFFTLLLVLQTPRAQRVIFAYDGLSAEIFTEEDQGRTHVRTRADLAEQAARQRHVLADLDKIERTAREQGINRAVLRQSLGRIIVPGMPETIAELSALDLLDIPDIENPDLDSSR